MMPNDANIAALCADIYNYADRPHAVWDHFEADAVHGICWALKRCAGYDVVVFRGSETLQDWRRDFRAIAVESRIGTVHAGFYAGMEHAWTDIRPLIRQPVYVSGHSLGAARASIMTAIMIVDGMPPARRVVLGEPRPGFANLGKIVASVPGASYRNAKPAGFPFEHDLITDVPFDVDLINYDYAHPTKPVDVFEPPNATFRERWGLFAWHHVELYTAALDRMFSGRPSVPISA